MSEGFLARVLTNLFALEPEVRVRKVFAIPYTVILRRPEGVASEWPDDIAVMEVWDESPKLAVEAARYACSEKDFDLAQSDADPEDYWLVCVFEGHHRPLPV
jgi:hypothetical protein